jgi:single-strand DNA-binding protein
MNLVILKGNVGREPEVRPFDSGSVVMTFSIATSERYKDKDGKWADGPTQWHNIQLWGHDRIDYTPVQKGDIVHILGKIQYREYTKDDEKRIATDIIATEVNIIKKISKVPAVPPPTADNDPKAKWSDGSAFPTPIGGDVELPNDNSPF